jgi:hypothetical protein
MKVDCKRLICQTCGTGIPPGGVLYWKYRNETPRSKLRGISTKDISNNNAASSGVFTLRENKYNNQQQSNLFHTNLTFTEHKYF